MMYKNNNFKNIVKKYSVKKLAFNVGSFGLVTVIFYNSNNEKILLKVFSVKNLLKIINKELNIKLSADMVLSNLLLKDWIINQRDLYL